MTVQYDAGNSIMLSERDSCTVKAVLILRSGLVWDLFADGGRRPVDAWVAFLNGRRFMLREFEDTLKQIKEEYFNDQIGGLLEPDFFKGSLIRRRRFFSSWPAVAPLAYAEYTDSIDVAKKFNQWCSFASRLSLLDLDLEDQVLSEYIEDEERLEHFEFPDSLVSDVEKVFYEWMKDFHVNWNLCSHGSGACAELPKGCPAFLKNHFLGKNSHIHYLLQQEPELREIYPLHDHVVDYCNVVQSVPKNIRTNRLVSKEPAAYQYLQHGIDKSLVEYLEKNPTLDAYFHPKDQCVNRRAALYGSSFGHVSTRDLSKASDTVAAKLAKCLTRRLPHLRRALICTRSLYARLQWKNSDKPDYIIRLNKYAPMGSGTCFRIEDIVFGSVIEATFRQEFNHPSKPGQWSVYGDDLIVPSRMVSRLNTNLRLLGFLVNHSKSYGKNTPGVFRESCGAECFAGTDITPLRVSRFFGYTRLTRSREYPRCVQQTVDFANNAYVKGLMRTRIACLYLLRGILLPYGGLSSLRYISRNIVENDFSYYYSDGRRRYDWLFPIPHSSVDIEMLSAPLPYLFVAEATNYTTKEFRSITGPHGPYYLKGQLAMSFRCLIPVLDETTAVKQACRRNHISPSEVEKLMIEEWFLEARLRDHGYRQVESVDNVDSWDVNDIAPDSRCISIQREGLTQRLKYRRVVNPSEADILRVWQCQTA